MLFDKGENDEHLNKITEHCKDYLIKQYDKMLSTQLEYSKTCMSCQYRKDPDKIKKAWPCQHFMYKKYLEGKQHLVSIEDIPERGLINKEEIEFVQYQSKIIKRKDKNEKKET